jgi:hypothetical protein
MFKGHDMKHHHAATQSEPDVAPSKKRSSSASKGGKAASRDDNQSVDWRIDMVRQAAYSFYEARNFQDGHELDDWLQAEAQVDQKLNDSAAATQKH